MSGDKAKSIEEVLKRDHDCIDALWDDAILKREKDTKSSLKSYSLFVQALDEHIEAEEEVLFPYSLETRGNDIRQLVELMKQEHVEVRKYLGQISAEISSGRLPDIDIEAALKDILWNHNTREEGMYYPFFEAEFSRREGEGLMASVLSHLRSPRE